MASNMSELEEAEEDVDNDVEVIVPWPHYYTIWDWPKINKVVLDENGVIRNGWRCNWCMNPPAMFALFSATKALARVLRLPGSDVCPCMGIITKTFVLGYKDLYRRKMDVSRSCSNNKNSMADSIDNIQERTSGAMSAASAKSGAMSAASAGIFLAAASESANKCGAFLV
jgi:hypothetical protein